MVWTRDAERNWQRRDVKGLGEVVELAAVKLTLALADLYEGVVFPSSLRLVLSADDGAAFVPSRPALKSVRRPCT